MKQKGQLSGFLIRRLVAVLCFVAISQSAISLFFTTVFYPLIKSHFDIDLLAIVHATNSSPVMIGKSLLWFAAAGLVNVVPEFMRIPLRSFMDWVSNQGWERYFAQIPAWNQTKMTLILTMLLLFVLIIYLLPYVLATLMYSRWVLRKMSELRAQDAQERMLIEKQRNLLLSDIAHDLKTPITTISGYANALRDHMVEEENQEKYLDTISAKSLQMSQLINLLFQYVTLDSEGFTLKQKKINISELVSEIVAVNYTDIETAGFELEMNVPETPIWISADEVQISRAITNLIQNAIRHNPEKTVIGITVKNMYDHVSIEVADSGELIEASIREHLFDPFVMGDASRSERGGSGLGLSISSKIMELHGGTLTLLQPYESSYDKVNYTKAFHVELPIM